VLETGILGRVLQVRLHGGYSLDEAATSHLNQPDDIGGAFFVIGCHLIDLLIHHLGMPDSANAKIPKFGACSARDRVKTPVSSCSRIRIKS
jgi:predicted dehydrogenase